MSKWFEPPGGQAGALNDEDVIIVAQNGVTRSVTRGEFLRGTLQGYVFQDSGGTGKRCFAQTIWTGEYDDAGRELWVWELTGLPD